MVEPPVSYSYLESISLRYFLRTATVMGRKQTTGDVLNARAKTNGYKKGADREEEINKEDRSEVYDVSIFYYLMARPDLILTSGRSKVRILSRIPYN